MRERVISADNHLIDPRDLYVERLPRELRDRAPRVVRGDDGGDGWSWFGRPPARTFGLEAVAGQADRDGAFRPTGMTWDEILPGNWDGAAHLADMDRDGIAAAVVYPNVAMQAYSVPDAELRTAVMRTYSDWLLSDFEAADPTRLRGLCPLPVDEDVELSVAEVHRLVANGARGFFVPGSPVRPYWDPVYDPLWRALSETGSVVSFHRNHGGRPPDSEAPQLDVPGINVGGIVVRFFSAVTPLTYMIFTGVFERFPDLRVVVGEVNCGWLPFWLENMDQNFEQQRHWARLPIDRPPSVCAGVNVFVTTLDDHVGFAALRSDPRLADAVMFSIDYPHSVTLWPESQRHVAELTPGLTDEARTKVLSATADRLYRFAAGRAASAASDAALERIPSGPEDVDPEWLTAAFAPRFPGVRVAAVDVVEVRQVTNCHSFLAIRYDEQAGAPDAVFAKMAPLEPGRRAVILESRMGTKEVDFYNRLAPRLPGIRKPDVYVARKDDDALTFVMLMEDLVGAGCRIPDGTWGITPDAAAVALEELADLHVRFEDPARRQREVPWAPLARDGKAPGQGLLRYGLDHHRDKLSDTFAWATQTYLAHPDELIAMWANGPGPHTVNHGDPHIGNLFDDHGRVGFLDWGVINVTTPIRDAGYLLTMAMQVEDRRAHERDLLRHYLAARKAKGGQEIGFDEAWATHRLHALYCVPAACQIVTFPEDAPPRRRVFAAAFLARVEAALEDLEVATIVRELTGWD